MSGQTVVLSEVVKPMERGQVTIPIKMRRKLGIDPKTWLWIKMTSGGRIYLEPVVEKDGESDKVLKEVVEKMVSLGEVFWTKEDDEVYKGRKNEGKKRIKSLNW